MRDIARETNLSIMTVSMALRDVGDVSPATRKRVLEAAALLKYRPNLLVRGMQTGQSGMIGVLMPVHGPFYAAVFSGIHDALVENKYVPLVLWSAADAQFKTGSSEVAQIHELVDRRVEGIILKPVVEAVSDQYLREVWERNIPLIAIDRELPETHADFVGTEDHEGGRLAARHLLELGHRRFAYVDLNPDGHVGTYSARREGFADAIAETPGTSLVNIRPAPGEDLITAARKALKSKGKSRPTAIFAPNDRAVVDLYDIAAELGLSIPRDLSIVGYSDLASTTSLRPRLTSVRQDAYRIGRQAAQLVLKRIAGKLEEGQPVKERLMPELVVRESTAPAAAKS